jgi:cell division protein FtsB
MLSAMLVFLIVGVAASAVFGGHGLTHLTRLRGERRELARATFARLERNARLREEIERLRGDDLYLEQLARRQLGLVKPNETVYRLRRPTD